MTNRSQYLVFLSIWIAAIAVSAFVGLSVETKNDALSLALLAALPAAAGIILVRKARRIIDHWRMRQGRDVNQEREYEDAGGFIHLYPVPPIEQQREISIREFISDVRDNSDSTSGS